MIEQLRRRYNEDFNNEAYEAMLAWMEGQYGQRPNFHVAETPVFIPTGLRDKLVRASEDVMDTLLRPDFMERSAGALLADQTVPGENPRPAFIQADFAICRAADGSLEPQLIEAQGFPSLYFFQEMLAGAYRRFFDIPEHFTSRFNGITSEEYHQLLEQTILAGYNPEEVILLEILPDTQNTRIDFKVASSQLGIPICCISELELENDKLYYRTASGERQRVRRIFNRVIFDELFQYPELKRQFNMIEEVDVEWAGHPNWFYRLSKHTLPMIESPYSPEAHFLSDLKGNYPADLKNYVLKPLYSFAGAGVILDLENAQLDAIKSPEHYILQRKVDYVPLVPTLDDPAKLEIRMMYLWPPGTDRPVLVNNLVRLSKGKMIGVKFNKDRTWVGGSVGYFEP